MHAMLPLNHAVPFYSFFRHNLLPSNPEGAVIIAVLLPKREKTMESLTNSHSMVFVGAINHSEVSAQDLNKIVHTIQSHINGFTSQGLHTFQIFYDLSEVDLPSWKFLISYVIPPTGADISMDKLGIVGTLSGLQEVRTMEDMLSVYRESFPKRNSMTVVRCIRGKCFINPLFGFMEEKTVSELIQLLPTGSAKDPNDAEAKLEMQLSKCNTWINPQDVERKIRLRLLSASTSTLVQASS